MTPVLVSADALVFDPDERGPSDDLKLQFEAIKAMLDGMIVKHRTKQIVDELRNWPQR